MKNKKIHKIENGGPHTCKNNEKRVSVDPFVLIECDFCCSIPFRKNTIILLYKSELTHINDALETFFDEHVQMELCGMQSYF